MIRITAKKEGFRRAGIAHSATPTDHADDAFSGEQLKALESDPMLTVQRVPNPAPASDAKQAGDEADKRRRKDGEK